MSCGTVNNGRVITEKKKLGNEALERVHYEYINIKERNGYDSGHRSVNSDSRNNLDEDNNIVWNWGVESEALSIVRT